MMKKWGIEINDKKIEKAIVIFLYSSLLSGVIGIPPYIDFLCTDRPAHRKVYSLSKQLKKLEAKIHPRIQLNNLEKKTLSDTDGLNSSSTQLNIYLKEKEYLEKQREEIKDELETLTSSKKYRIEHDSINGQGLWSQLMVGYSIFWLGFAYSKIKNRIKEKLAKRKKDTNNGS